LGLRREKEGETEELFNDEVSGLHPLTGVFLGYQIEGNEMDEACGEKCIHRFGVKSEGKRLRGRTGRRREYDIKRILKPIEWEPINWINFAQERKSDGL
jgi:hypothetical protein